MSRKEFPMKVKKAAYDRSGGLCECGCGQAFTDHPKERPVYDHIVPDNLGGEPTLENCRAIRWYCHVIKTAKDMKQIGKARRGEKDRAGMTRKRSNFAGSRDGKWKKRIDGTTVLRNKD